jgi:6-pyruvoyltetrahydropterin/6-carboxytetrahydropterin synthase
MLQLTKIFHFEMAHAIHGYAGACKDIHGHSYKLHVTVAGDETDGEYIPAPGLLLDFKELKRSVIASFIQKVDHKLVVSQDYVAEHPGIRSEENLVILEAEPTAENLLIYIQRILSAILPFTVKLAELTLYETKDSFARWVNNKI